MASTDQSTLKFPGLFHASDEASLRAQRAHVLTLKASLVLLVIGGALSAISISNPVWKFYAALISTASLVVCVALSIITRMLRKDKQWYECRAIAESVKSMAWRYITATGPFRNHAADAADRAFLDDLERLNKEHSGAAKEYKEELIKLPQITTTMRELRQKAVDGRLQAYVKERVGDQLGWYAKKTRTNSVYGLGDFLLVITCQIGGVFFAGARVFNSITDVYWAAICVSLATALIAWSQFRKYEELAQSYGQAAAELSVIRDRASAIRSEEDLSGYIGETELAISREHTLWLARRDHR